MSGWLIIAIVVMVIVGVSICICRSKSSGSANRIGSDAGFDEAVSVARSRPQVVNSAAITTPSFENYAGDFEVKYNDRGKVMSGCAKIRLKKSDTVCGTYAIEGECSDADGTAKIIDGSVAYSGEGWWVEETLSGTDRGLKVLTQGRFDFATNAFTGNWRANTGVMGNYTVFRGKNISKTFISATMASNPQTLEQQLAEDIPTVVATVETQPGAPSAPTVQAVPAAATSVAIPIASATNPSAPPEPELYIPRV